MKNRIDKIIEKLKQHDSENRVGKKYHAWKTVIWAEHISNEYLGIIEYIGKRESIVNPFFVKLESGKESEAGTIDFFSNVDGEPPIHTLRVMDLASTHHAQATASC